MSTFAPMKTIMYLTRHGQTEENVSHILQGWMPGHLSTEGIKQVSSLRDRLKDVHFDALVCSDLKRCIDSANILNEQHHLPITTTPLLRERNWGSLTGKNILNEVVNLNVKEFPADVESEFHIYERALKFIRFIQQHFAGKQILAVGHGMIDRYIQAVWKGTTIREIPRMENAEIRQLVINEKTVYGLPEGVVPIASEDNLSDA